MKLQGILGLLLYPLFTVCCGSDAAQMSDGHASIRHYHGKRLDASVVTKMNGTLSFLHCCALCHESEGCSGVAYSDTDCWLVDKAPIACGLFDGQCSTCEYNVIMYKSEVGKEPTDCKLWLEQGCTNDGVYTLSPPGSTPFQAFCDMTNGGWTVFQRRVDDSVGFFRGYQSYVAGFGDLHGNFWAGLDNIHAMTVFQDTELLVTMDTFEGESAEAHYSSFYVDDAASGYRMTVGGYSGPAGDSLARHNLKKFSTFDNDQDTDEKNCADYYDGAWWYAACHDSNPNGLYLHGTDSQYAKGVVWRQFKGYTYSLKTFELKVKRTN